LPFYIEDNKNRLLGLGVMDTLTIAMPYAFLVAIKNLAKVVKKVVVKL